MNDRCEVKQAVKATIEAADLTPKDDILFSLLVANSDLAGYADRKIADALYDLVKERHLLVKLVPRIHINH